jgi:hypothetical protein
VSAAVDERPPEVAADDVVFETPALLRILWSDPQHMPEHIAVWSLARFGPRANAAVARLRAARPDADRERLEQLVVQRQARVAATEGAFVGGPFILLVPVAFCAALLAQAQMVYELAAVAGRDASDRMRAADLLVMLGAYASVDDATAALGALPADPHAAGKKLPRGTRVDMVRRMAYLLGVLGATDESRSRLRNALGWAGIGVLFLVGLVLPLVWVPYMGYSTRRSTLRLARKALSYYAAGGTAETGVSVRRRQAVRVGGTAALVRTAVFVVLPVVAAVAALLGGVSFGDGKWVDAALLLLAISALVTVGWLGYRWWRHRRRGGAVESAA